MAKRLAHATKPRKPLPEELAKDAIAHEQPEPGGKVRLKVDLPELLAAEAIRREINLPAFVTVLLAVAATKLPASRGGGS